MNIPITLTDLSIWLGATALILLLTSELLGTPSKYSSRILVDKTRMRIAAIGCGLAFMVTAILGVI